MIPAKHVSQVAVRNLSNSFKYSILTSGICETAKFNLLVIG